MALLPKVDVVFVGFGMVGGIIANEISKRATNLKMVGLERGPFRDTYPDFVVDHHDEWKYAVQGQLFQDYSQETSTFRNDIKQNALPIRQLGSFLPGNGVGGAMVHWNGQTWRFLPDFFVYRTHLEQRYGKSFLPPDTTIQDWGVTYDELEPYYTQFDKTMGISGKAGNIKGQIQPGGNPFEGPRSEEYPQAPYQVAYSPKIFGDAANQLGYKSFIAPSANSPNAYTNPDGQTLGACNYCGHCERFGCHVGAKASPIVTVIPNALKSGRVEVRPFSNVFRINHTGGMATSVSYYDQSGMEQEQPADLIVVGSFTLNNIRLMLMSKIGDPYDPQANKGTVGRNFTHQLGGAGASGWFNDRTLNRFMGSGANGIAMDEFNGDNFDHKDLGFFGGGNISVADSGARPIMSTATLPPGTPAWGSNWKSAVKQYYDTYIAIGMQAEHAAYRQNYVDLDPTYRDAQGNPLLRITMDWTDNERKLVDWVNKNVMQKLIDAVNPAIKRVNGPITSYNSVPYQSTHINGGTVMGADPGTSTVNKYCQVWGMPNLFVVGASNFPQNGGYNPTGTVGALAYHTADAIINQYLKSPGMIA